MTVKKTENQERTAKTTSIKGAVLAAGTEEGGWTAMVGSDHCLNLSASRSGLNPGRDGSGRAVSAHARERVAQPSLQWATGRRKYLGLVICYLLSFVFSDFQPAVVAVRPQAIAGGGAPLPAADGKIPADLLAAAGTSSPGLIAPDLQLPAAGRAGRNFRPGRTQRIAPRAFPVAHRRSFVFKEASAG